MASIPNFSIFALIATLVLLLGQSADAQLRREFHDSTCPAVQRIVREVMTEAVARERRMGASILRMFFHDCFVNGCDASVLLDDTRTFTGEKGAPPNLNSLRGFEIIDAIKTRIEANCPNTVSCADILALAARDGVELLGGPRWEVPLGRRDSRTASQSAVLANIPSPLSDLPALISGFSAKGFSARDMVVLSGAHNVGFAQCRLFRNRIYNETNIDANFAALRRQNCPATGGDSNLATLDAGTPLEFENNFYRNLVNRRGLLHSDQQLFNGGSTDSVVQFFSENDSAFRRDFAEAMVRLGSLSPLTGTAGEIRSNCRFVN